MSNEEAKKVLKELEEVRPEKLNDKAKRLFEAIMKIADDRDKAKQELYEANSIISEYIDIVKHQDKLIDEILKTWKQDDVRNIAELKKYFEERCK